MIGMILSPSGTGRVPPGRKQFCTSITARTSSSPGRRPPCARTTRGSVAHAIDNPTAPRNRRRAAFAMALALSSSCSPRTVGPEPRDILRLAVRRVVRQRQRSAADGPAQAAGGYNAAVRRAWGNIMEKFRGVDYYGIEELLSEEQRMVRDAIRDWVEAEFLPVVAEHHRAGTFPIDLILKLGELGVFGATLKGYGCAGL